MMIILQSILSLLAKLTIARYQPKIIGITGSVGKTSTKDAVAVVLGGKFRIRASRGNFNNEIGLPLTVLGYDTGGKNFLKWCGIIIAGLFQLIASDYPEFLVLEMGADKPGDIESLLKLTGKLDFAVITDVGISHLQFFASPKELAREKLSLLKGFAKIGIAVLNVDNPVLDQAKHQIRQEVVGYGFKQDAEIFASDFQIVAHEGSFGVIFKVHYKGTVVPFFIPDALGRPAVYAVLPAAAIGLKLGLNLVEISQALKNYESPAGRLKLIAGIKNTWIVDDTYNSAPSSTIAALEALFSIAPSRKLVALGEMAELGTASESGQREVAVKIIDYGISEVFLVGENTRLTEDELRKRNFLGRIYWYESSDHAQIPVQENLQEGDAILIKGSQSARMEKIVKEIMLNPQDAENLLVRQSQKWLDKL